MERESTSAEWLRLAALLKTLVSDVVVMNTFVAATTMNARLVQLAQSRRLLTLPRVNLVLLVSPQLFGTLNVLTVLLESTLTVVVPAYHALLVSSRRQVTPPARHVKPIHSPAKALQNATPVRLD